MKNDEIALYENERISTVVDFTPIPPAPDFMRMKEFLEQYCDF